MAWCPCLTASCVPGLFYMLCLRTVIATCLNASVQLPEVEKGHIRYPCVCLLSLCGPKS